jgi:RNA polymerase sigma-70 factor (ECF subfamily)
MRHPAVAGAGRSGVTVAVAGGAAVDTEALWLHFRGQLRGFVARRLAHPADVDDVLQWVFLRLHQNLGRLRESERVHAWLYRTARRAIADYYRAKARNREIPSGAASDLERLESAATPAPDAGDLDRLAACLSPMVEQLPAPYREAIVRADLQGVRLAELARSAGLSLSGMKARVQRGRKRLHRLLADCCRRELAARGGARSGQGCGTACGCRDAGPNEE